MARRPQWFPTLPARKSRITQARHRIRWASFSRRGESIQRGCEGQALTEYLIIVLLVALVSIAATRKLGETIKRKIQGADERINGMHLPKK